MADKIVIGNRYFITFTVVGWVDVFTRENHKQTIVDSLKFCQNEKGLIIYAWVLMSNHLHLIAGTKEGYNLSDIIRDFKKHTSKIIIQNIKEEAESRREWMLEIFRKAAKHEAKDIPYKLWAEGNEPKELYTNRFIDQKLDYIHTNPVKQLIVDNPQDYKFSSAVNYAGSKGLLEVELV